MSEIVHNSVRHDAGIYTRMYALVVRSFVGGLTGSRGNLAASLRVGMSIIASGPPKGTKVSTASIDTPRSDIGPVFVLCHGGVSKGARIC